MRAKIIMLASLSICGSLGAYALGAADLAKKLVGIGDYRADAQFEVLLPSASDPVVYNVHLQSESAPGDTLSPCNYLIMWDSETPSGLTEGFSAYFDGDHYRYRNNRLQEYHAAASIMPFMPQGPGSAMQGVQSTAQFADMLPQFLGDKLAMMEADSTYIYRVNTDTVVGGRRCIAVAGVKRGDGYDVMRFTYTFDPETLYPIYTDIESSPGSISEQILTITYSAPTSDPVVLREDSLMARWPEVFEKYRQSTFKAENLVGTPLPSFACRVAGGTQRETHNVSETFPAPSVFVFLDPQVSTATATVEAIREAVDSAPMDIRVYWVFTTNLDDEALALLGNIRAGEYPIMSANSLVRNCGITLYPTTLIVDRGGIVKNVLPGHNKDLAMVVLQKTMLAN